jgi:dolichyl-phosphate-mannose-protein mannosyltransferase
MRRELPQLSVLVASAFGWHPFAMTVARPDPAERVPPQSAGGGWGLMRSAQRWASAHSEPVLVGLILAAFIVLWMGFQTVSLAPVDLRDDAAEAALWAQSFAFGYKHPPLTAWLFMAWFAVFPRTNWAMHLEAVVIVAATLAITWRLLRDHLDRNRSLFGLAALILVPLYSFKAAELNANTVMMPFWAAALLFYSRARRGLDVWDSLLAGAFASFAMLGKYWAVYLFAGMAAAALTGTGARQFWRSPAPYVMAAGATLVIAPHLYWYVSHAGGTDYAFVRDSVMTDDSFAAALAKSAYYLLGVIAYAAGPLLLLAALRPGRAALADIAWPADDPRQQALILFAVPMVLPALVNLVLPARLTPDWTYPNWALLPIVLYGSRKIAVDSLAAAGAALIALAVSVCFLIASPFMAYAHLKAGLDSNRPSSREVAELAERLTNKPARLYWGSPGITGNLPFYLAGTDRLEDDPLSDLGRSETSAQGLIIACLDNDTPCLTTQAALGGAGVRTANGSISHSFLGFSGKPIGFHVTVVPAQH